MDYNNVNDLIKKLNTIDAISDESWQATLNDRKIKEMEFHDKDGD